MGSDSFHSDLLSDRPIIPERRSASRIKALKPFEPSVSVRDENRSILKHAVKRALETHAITSSHASYVEIYRRLYRLCRDLLGLSDDSRARIDAQKAERIALKGIEAVLLAE